MAGRIKGSRGFSLMEILITLALMALVVGVFVVNFDVLFAGFTQKTPEKWLHEAIRESRYFALSSQKVTYLKYDGEKNLFVIYNDEVEELEKVETEDGIAIKFVFEPPKQVFGGDLKSKKVEKELKYVTFSPDGTNTPVFIDIESPDGKARLKLDPLSTGLVLVASEA